MVLYLLIKYVYPICLNYLVYVQIELLLGKIENEFVKTNYDLIMAVFIKEIYILLCLTVGRCHPVPIITNAVPNNDQALPGSLVIYTCQAGIHT